MPASLPGDTLANNLANPNAGKAVLYSLLSGPKGSPFDRDQSGNASTGGLSNGIGLGPSLVIGLTAPASIVAASFTDDYTLGVTKPDGTASANSTIMHIGGGRSNPDGTPLVYAQASASAVPATAAAATLAQDRPSLASLARSSRPQPAWQTALWLKRAGSTVPVYPW